jgi:hypothetical protein
LRKSIPSIADASNSTRLAAGDKPKKRFTFSQRSRYITIRLPFKATGSGGEIRDEGAVERGSTPKAGRCGFWVSDILIPDHQQPWEIDISKPLHYASSLDIMLEAPIGSARLTTNLVVLV